MGFIDFVTYIKHLGEKALVFFPSKADLISVTDKDGNPTEEMLSERLDTLISKDGDASDVTVTFQEAAERANIQSSDSLATAFAKLSRFCLDLETLETNVNNNKDRIVNGEYEFRVIDNSLQGVRVSGNGAVKYETFGSFSKIGQSDHAISEGYFRTLYENGKALSSTYAKLASPTFTGTPKAPTPVSTSSDTSIATTAFVKEQMQGLGNSDSLVSDILNVFKQKKENRIFKLIYPQNMSGSGYDVICTSLYPNVGDYFYSSGEQYVSYAGRKITLDKGWYKIKTDLALLDPDNINMTDVYPYPLFCHPVVSNSIGFEDPEFITAEENGINAIIQEEERLGNALFTKEYELKDAIECVKEENQYLGESAYWCPGLIEGKAIPKGSIWYVNDDTDTSIGYYQAKIDIVSTFTYNVSCKLSPSPDPYEKFYFEYLGTSYKVYAGMPNSNYKQVQRDSMLEEIREILENHIK